MRHTIRCPRCRGWGTVPVVRAGFENEDRLCPACKGAKVVEVPRHSFSTVFLMVASVLAVLFVLVCSAMRP